MKETNQKFGGFLTGVITPSVGACIAWVLIMKYLITM